MLENGMRLQVSIEKDGFTIIDTLTDNVILYRNGVYVKDDLVHEDVLDNLLGMEQLAMDSKIRRSVRMKCDDEMPGVVITQLQHCQFRVRYDKEEALVEESSTKCTRKYDSCVFVNAIAGVVETLAKTGNTILAPKSDCCRRISDLGLIAMKSSKHLIVVRSNNKIGNVLTNCLVDDTTFQWLYVSCNIEEGKVHVFNCDFNEVAEFKYDESFSVYFADDKDCFKEVEVNE